MRVVVTRPEDRAQATAAKLRALGHQPLLLPLSKARHLTGQAAAVLSRRYPAIAITSAEALRAADKNDLAPHLSTPLLAVGRKTAEAASAFGFTDIRIAAGNGAALAQLISEHPSFADLLYLTGRPRSSIFEDALKALSVRHSVLECYEMMPLQPQPETTAAVLQPQADAILFHSRETARLFFDLTTVHENLPAMTPRLIACLSERVAEIVPAGLHDRIRIAERPDEANLIGLLSPS